MGRHKLKLMVSGAQQDELGRALKERSDPRERDRIQTVRLATTGRHTHEEIAALVGRARSTVQVWVNRYEAGGGGRVAGPERRPPVGRANCKTRRSKPKFRPG